MTRTSLKTIETQIRKLQARAQALREKDRKPVIASIVRQMKSHDISLGEIGEALGKSRTPARGPRKAPAAKASRTPVAAKYKDPATGATWSGRGRTPRWIVEAEKAGKDRSSFSI